MRERFDAIVIGAGIAGETCARALGKTGAHVALVERDRIGGECAYWAAIPSESLLGPANARQRAQAAAGIASPALASPWGLASSDALLAYVRESAQREAIERDGGAYIAGDAHLLAPGHVQVDGRELEAPHVVISSGSEPTIPAIAGLAEAGYWTNREATTAQAIPPSVVVLGGESQAIELGQRFRLFGAEVTLVTQQEHLLAHEEPALGGFLAQHLHQQGLRVVLGRTVLQVERGQDPAYTLTLDDHTQVHGQALVVATGRQPRIQGLGLEHAGVQVGPQGIVVDDTCRAAEGIWAVGDVTGVAPLSHMAQYQARLAADDILGHAHPAHYRSVPRVLFTDPQVAATGWTTSSFTGSQPDQSAAFTSVTVDLKEHASRTPASAHHDLGGKLTLAVDTRRDVLVGAWAVAAEASAWIQLAELAIRAEIPLGVFRDVLEQFPTSGEVYLAALDQLAGAAT
jgi:dihydrolipoamide dehydrogenase